MPPEPIVACSLSATELPARLTEMAEVGHAALLDARQTGPHADLRFAAAAGVRARLEAIVAAESRCCPFLAMRLRDEPGAVLLRIEAPDGAADVVGELVGAFRSREPAR